MIKYAYVADLLIIVSKPYRLFYDAVKTDSFWDHKWQLSALFPSMGLSRRYHHVYGDKDIPYDVWANIHFGVIGNEINSNHFTLLKGAGTEQVFSDVLGHIKNLEVKDAFIRLLDIRKISGDYGDNGGDVEAINIGFQISNGYDNKTVEKVTNQMLNELSTFSRTLQR